MEEKQTLTLTDKDYTLTAESYDEFSCKGGACRNTCCQNWMISITRSEYNKVGKLCDRSPNLPNKNEIFKRRPHSQATDMFYATIALDPATHHCPLFSDDGLCTLQIECGYAALPSICKSYPRIKNYILDEEFLLSLDISCERVLELLYQKSDHPLQFHKTRTQPTKGFLIPDLQPDTQAYFLDIRNLCLLILQNRAYTLPERLLLLGITLRDLQKLLDAHALAEIPGWFARSLPFTQGGDAKEFLQDLKGNSEFFVHNNLRYLIIEAHRDEEFHPLLLKILNTIGYTSTDGVSNFDLDAYHRACDAFHAQFPAAEGFFEHCLIMWMLKKLFPLGSENEVWSSYMTLCSVYSLLSFTASTSMPENSQQLIDHLVLLFRHLTSKTNLDKYTSKQFEYNNSDTLAHLAILLLG